MSVPARPQGRHLCTVRVEKVGWSLLEGIRGNVFYGANAVQVKGDANNYVVLVIQLYLCHAAA